MKPKLLHLTLLLAGLLAMSSCKREASNTTGWNYNDPKFGGFQNHPGYEQETGPGLVFIEGGTFAMGRVEQDVLYDWNNAPKRISVSSFYMDETEIRNIDYREYLYWLRHVYSIDYNFLYRQALPDTLVWRERMAYNEPMVELYLRHPAYEEYPVVGVSWVQASKYCEWRTDRVNELILVREGIIDDYRAPLDGAINNFNTDVYLVYPTASPVINAAVGESDRDGLVEDLYNPDPQAKRVENRRPIQIEDGIFLPRYRLPTEAEWEYAALAHIGNHYRERIYNRRLYPWDGHYIRKDPSSKEQGQILANTVRGRGDYMGVAGALNDKADITAPVRSYWPNEYGLYCMAGNVNEWVMDVYRDMTFGDMEEFRPYRGNVFTQYEIAIDPNDGMIELTREAENYFEYSGKILRKPVNDEHCFNRENYTTADNINYLDGDLESLIPGQTSDGWNSDGNFTHQTSNDTAKLKIDLTIFPDNSVFSDNTVLLPNNIEINLKEKTYNLPEDHTILESGEIQLQDGTIISQGGVISLTDGTVIYPDKIFNTTDKMYDDGTWGEGTWGDGIYDPNNPKENKGEGMKSLITDRSRVFKGGSWKDRAYWLVPGTRRFLDEKMGRSDLGFRCAMTRVGAPVQSE